MPPTCTRSPAGTSPAPRSRGTSRWWTSCRTPRPGGSPSTGSRSSEHPRRSTLADANTPDHDQSDWLRTWIGWSAPDRITVAGRDLPADIMGRLSLTELAFLLVTRREPTAGERRVLDAALVSLADHGLTPSALAARLTFTGAPEATQAAVAAGLLGAGSVFLGPTGDTAQFLADALVEHDAREPVDDATLRDIASAAVDAQRAAGMRVPGLGH